MHETKIEAALALRLAGRTVPEIAATLNIHRRTVNKLLAKAKAGRDFAGDDDAGDDSLGGEVPDGLIPESSVDAALALQSSLLVEVGRIAAEQASNRAVHPDLIGRAARALQQIAAMRRDMAAAELALLATSDDAERRIRFLVEDRAEQLAQEIVAARLTKLAEERPNAMGKVFDTIARQAEQAFETLEGEGKETPRH